MSFSFIALAFCLVPVTGVASGLVDLFKSNSYRRSIVSAFATGKVE